MHCPLRFEKLPGGLGRACVWSLATFGQLPNKAIICFETIPSLLGQSLHSKPRRHVIAAVVESRSERRGVCETGGNHPNLRNQAFVKVSPPPPCQRSHRLPRSVGFFLRQQASLGEEVRHPSTSEAQPSPARIMKHDFSPALLRYLPGLDTSMCVNRTAWSERREDRDRFWCEARKTPTSTVYQRSPRHQFRLRPVLPPGRLRESGFLHSVSFPAFFVAHRNLKTAR
jgi:hypothetical protein